MATESKAKDTPAAKAPQKASNADRHLANLKDREKVLLAKQERLPKLKGDQMAKATERVAAHLEIVRNQIKEATK